VKSPFRGARRSYSPWSRERGRKARCGGTKPPWVWNETPGDRPGISPRPARAATAWLRTRTHERKIDTFVEPELARRLENGEQPGCEEIPVLGEADEVPF